MGLVQIHARKMTSNDIEREFKEYIISQFNGMMTFKSINDAYWAIDDKRKVILISMGYQFGRGGLSGFTEFLPKLKEGKWKETKAGMLNSKCTWQQTPNHANRHASVIVNDCSDYYTKCTGYSTWKC